MSEQDEGLTIRRILIALDTSYHSLAALRAAAWLASSLDAELHGLFVEDINLWRAAGLPMARELQFPFAAHAPMNPERMRRQLRAQASQARRALASICRRHQIEWTFQVVRGGVSSKVLEEAAKADLLCLGRISRPVMQRPGLGSTARAAATSAQRSVLLISHGTHIHPPVVVAYDGSPDAEQALLLASRLTQELGGFLYILVPADAPRSSDEIQQQMFDIARQRRDSSMREADNWDEFTRLIDDGGFVQARVFEDTAVEQAIQEETKATVRLIPFEGAEDTGPCIKSGRPGSRRVVLARAY